MNSPEQRVDVLTMVHTAQKETARLSKICEILGLDERTVQRWQREGNSVDKRPSRIQAPTNKLSEAEREEILATVNSVEFSSLPASQIVPRLADKGQYIASESTFYRVMRAAHQMTHRRRERISQPRPVPFALKATLPNQIYSWDITYLPTTVTGKYFYLYLFMDIFSRKIVGWQVYGEERSGHAAELFTDICRRENLQKGQVILHSDNGSPMKGATMLATLQALGVMASFSRPAVSNDNPYSESLFKTLKYRPDNALSPFENLLGARHGVTDLVHWYNEEHRHSGIKFVTPEQRHSNQDAPILAQRKAVYEQAKMQRPERWSGATRNWQRIEEVHLNPSKAKTEIDGAGSGKKGEQKAA